MANSMESRGKQRKEITDVPGKEGWVLKSFFWIVVLERTLKSLLDCKEIKPLDPKENQSWIFIGSTDVKAETPVFWSPDVKNWFIGKDTDAGKDWGQEEKRGQQRMRWLDYITNSMGMNWANSRKQWRTGEPGTLQSMGSQTIGHNFATEQQQQQINFSLVKKVLDGIFSH